MVDAAEEWQRKIAENPGLVQPVDAPTFYATAFGAISSSGTDFTLIVQRAHPALIKGAPTEAQLALLKPVAIIQMSPSALKDLSLLLAKQIEQFEDAFGKVETEYTRRLAAERQK
jgi:hypothetical protein